ncbi:MAG: ABC transporter permease, partial [Peptococcaceae bacterium]|nr:ABC transporter permease [Peptococcaceae bacterium]
MGNAHSLSILSASRRIRTLFMIGISVSGLVFVFLYGIFMDPQAYDANFGAKNLQPSMAYLFGTDWLGRDMLARTIKGLSTSILVGITASVVSAVIAVILGTAAATLGKRVDTVITWFIDLFLSVPHIILIMLISIAVGKG